MFTPAAARSPFSIRSAPRATWASRCSSRCAWLSLWALTPPLPLPDDVMMCMGPRASRRSRPGSLTAAHEGLTLIFGFSTRSRAPIARTTHQRPLSPFQTLRREAPKRQNPDGVTMTNYDAFYIYISIYLYIYGQEAGSLRVIRTVLHSWSKWGPRQGGGRQPWGLTGLAPHPVHVPSVAQGPRSHSHSVPAPSGPRAIAI